jgi:hypothetical protein
MCGCEFIEYGPNFVGAVRFQATCMIQPIPYLDDDILRRIVMNSYIRV